MSSLKIYCPTHQVRSRYIIRTLLCEFMGYQIEFVEDLKLFMQNETPKLTYLSKPIEKIPNILNNGTIETDALFQTELPDLPLKNFTDDFNFSTDVFAICMFLLSRAEEYFSSNTDVHGRFLAANSTLAKKQMLNVPITDILSETLHQWIIKIYPELPFNKPKSSAKLSFDIDIAYSFKAKPIIRSLGATMRDLLSLQFQNLLTRFKVIKGAEKDPFDVYDILEELYQQTGIPQIYFFHVKSKGKFDKANNVKSKDFKHLVQRIACFAEIGLHPSYAGGQNFQQIIAEKQILEDITGKQIISSRQHFLRFQFPHTARVLAAAGISNDFSLGYAETTGWKAGTCRPFQIFDLQSNTEIPLITHPVAFMDGTLKDYMQLQPFEALKETERIFLTCQQHGGLCIPLWHNESVSGKGVWKHWNTEVFFPMVSLMNKMFFQNQSFRQ